MLLEGGDGIKYEFFLYKVVYGTRGLKSDRKCVRTYLMDASYSQHSGERKLKEITSIFFNTRTSLFM